VYMNTRAQLPRYIAIVLLVLAARAQAQERPLPDPAVFLPEVKKRLQTDQTLQSSYSFVETRRERKLDGGGRATSESVKVFENYPGLPGEPRWERLISEDGRAVPADELAKQDRERRQKAEEYARRLSAQPEKERARQNREWDKDRREVAKTVDDIFRVYDVRMVGREAIDGHGTIRFSLVPRPDAQPDTREGGVMRHFTGTAWVSESDYELVRVEIEAIDDLSIGLGLLARIHKGTTATYQRRKVNNETWLPAQVTWTAGARVLLVRRLRIRGISDFSGYRKFTVDTSTTYSTPSS